MRGDSARGMRGECEGNATVKARGEGGGARGVKQRGCRKKPKAQKSISAKPHATTLDHLAKALMLFFLRLLAFFCTPSAHPLPLPPLSLLFRLHLLASPCIPLRPLASPCIGFHLQHLLWGVGVSGCLDGSGCRGVWTARVSGCRLWVAALPLPLPKQLARRQRKQGVNNPAFFSLMSE